MTHELRKRSGRVPSACNRKKSPRKNRPRHFLGTAAVAGLVLGCAWTVYANIFAAGVYPTLDSAGYDEPVIKRPPKLAARIVPPVTSTVVAAVREPPPVISRRATVASVPPLDFTDRFAASAPQAVASAVPPQPAQQLAAPKPAEAPKLAEAPKSREITRPQPPVQVASVAPPTPPAAEAKPAKPPAASTRELAERAKAAVLSIASSEKLSITDKLWGKQPSRGSLLSYASADASITGSIAKPQNPMLGGSPPYDRQTAVYDIAAHAVYLPDGTRLEAHSGLGSKLDDPDSARIRMHGVTPPHIYELKPREALFHGVPALRLTPIGGEEAIYGRAGLLAHTYMLGPNGDSNGCVSFKDYYAFLQAYKSQGIRRLAVLAKVQ